MKLNDAQITVSGGLISVDRELKLGEEVIMIVHGSVIEEKRTDNQDGTYNHLARIKGTIAEVRSQEGVVISEEEENDNI